MGLVKARRGEGRGDVKGEAVEDFALARLEGKPKPCDEAGLAPVSEGEARGVVALGICHGAGEALRLTAWRAGGDGTGGFLVSLCRQRAPRTASSSARPLSAVCFRSSSSSLSVLSSSSSASLFKTGRQSS